MNELFIFKCFNMANTNLVISILQLKLDIRSSKPKSITCNNFSRYIYSYIRLVS